MGQIHQGGKMLRGEGGGGGWLGRDQGRTREKSGGKRERLGGNGRGKRVFGGEALGVIEGKKSKGKEAVGRMRCQRRREGQLGEDRTCARGKL